MKSSPDALVTCPHAPPCPGCPLLHLRYGAQLEVKQERVRRIAARFAELAHATVEPTRPADPIVGYRQRAKLVSSDAKIGLYARGTHDVVDIPHCRVLDPTILVAAQAIRHALPLGVPLRAVDLQRVEEGVIASLVVPDDSNDREARHAAERLSLSVPGLAGVAVSRRDETSHRVLGRTPVSVCGLARSKAYVHADGPWHYVVAGSFSQAHRGQQRSLVEAVLSTLERRRPLRGMRVLELYSGAGVLSLALAARGARVLAAEAYAPAAELCRDAASEQELDVTTRAADAAAVTLELASTSTPVDAVIVNPPRRGLTPAVRADIARLSPSVIVYVSCEPLTLSRDLSDLVRRGYEVRSLSPYDMMPLTEEVETLAVLETARAPAPVVLHADDKLIAVVKAPHEPTTPQGEHQSSLLDRVRRLEGAEGAVPAHRLDLGTSGVCLFARKPEHVEAIAKALANGEKEYVALARGITRDKGSIRRPLLEQGRPRPSRTRYRRLEVVAGHSLLSVLPEEGRKHQIRRHLGSIGHAVVGDERYGDERTNRHFEMRHFLDRPFLHCARITLVGEVHALELTAPLTPDLALVLEELRARQTV